MTEDYGLQAVVITQEVPVEPKELRDVLMESLGLNRIDAIQQAKRCGVPGILAEELPPDSAKRVEEELDAAGIESLVLPSVKLPRPEMKLVRKVEKDAEKLRLTETGKKGRWGIPWSGAVLIHAGVISEPSALEEYDSSGEAIASYGPAVMTMGKYRKRRVEPEPKSELWVCTRPPLYTWRFVEDEINYEYLGVRQDAATSVNFQLMLEDVMNGATNAYVTDSTESFVEELVPGSHGFDTHAEFGRYYRAYLILALLERGKL